MLKLFRLPQLDNHALIESLFKKYLQGTGSAEELEKLEQLLTLPENASFFQSLVLKELHQPENPEQTPDEDQLKKLVELFENIRKRLPD